MKRVWDYGAYFLIFFCITTLYNRPASAQVISDISGVVELKYQLNSSWRPADLGETLLSDSAIRTFHGQTSVRFLNSDLVKLDANTELQFSPTGIELKHGRAYFKAWKLQLYGMSEILLNGEGRIDLDDQQQHIAVLSGEAQIRFQDQVITLKSAEQLLIDPEGNLHHSHFSETEPWYRDLAILGEGKGQIIGIKGQADISKSAEAAQWQKAEVDMVVEVGSSLRTHDATWLELRFDDNNLIRLQANTELSLKILEDLENGQRQTVLELIYGKVWVIVENEGQPFQIETPGLIAGVRGTKFRLDAAESSEPALIKTFEGVVAGSSGFDTTFVEEGQQFDPQAGLAVLQIDELDLFNLRRDDLLNLPKLSLDPVPSQIASETLTLTGDVVAPIRLSLGSQTQMVEASTFRISSALKPGFNLLELYAYNETNPNPTKLVFPVIRKGKDIFVDGILKPFGAGYRLEGIAPPGASILVDTGFEVLETVADASSRFTLRLSKVNDPIRLSAHLSSGESATKEVMIRP